MIQKNNVVIAFSGKAEAALLELEKKYNLEENDEEAIKRFTINKPFKINILANLIREFTKNNISENLFVSSIQKDLSITNEIAKNIFKDVSNNIVPFLVKTSEEEIESGKFKNTNQIFLKQSTELADIKPAYIDEVRIKKVVADIPSEKLKKTILLPTEEPVPKPKRIKNSDKYRESVE